MGDSGDHGISARPMRRAHGPVSHIRYADGTEELYDHMRDPQEWTNIAGVEASRPVIAELAQWIPKHFAPNAPSKKAYHFDPHHGWTLRKEEARK